MEIRRARPEEYAEAGRATRAAYEEFAAPEDRSWQEYLVDIGDVAGRADRTVVLVAVEDGRILGTATVEFDERTIGDDDPTLPPEMAGLRMVGVDPSARGRGAGRALVEGAIRLAREEGKTVMALRTSPLMRAANRIYEQLGFVRDPERDTSYDGFAVLGYRMALTDVSPAADGPGR